MNPSRNRARRKLVREDASASSSRSSVGRGAVSAKRPKRRGRNLSALWALLIGVGLLLTLWMNGALLVSIEDKRVDLDDGGWPLEGEAAFERQRHAARVQHRLQKRRRRKRGVRPLSSRGEPGADGDRHGEVGAAVAAGSGGDAYAGGDPGGDFVGTAAPAAENPAAADPAAAAMEVDDPEQMLRAFLSEVVHRGGVETLKGDDLWNTAIVELARFSKTTADGVQGLGAQRTVLLARWFLGEKPQLGRQFLAANNVLPLSAVLDATELRNTLIVALNNVVGIEVKDLQLMTNEELDVMAGENAEQVFGDKLVDVVFNLVALQDDGGEAVAAA